MGAAIYARKSTDQTGVAEEARSVARQVARGKEYAAKHGWPVSDEHIYVDDGVSGADFTNRPGFLQLMNALKPSAAFQVLVMSEESRLGREAIETAYALKQIMASGVRVFFFLEDRERTLNGPTDKILLSVTADRVEVFQRETVRIDFLVAAGALRNAGVPLYELTDGETRRVGFFIGQFRYIGRWLRNPFAEQRFQDPGTP